MLFTDSDQQPPNKICDFRRNSCHTLVLSLF
ncbi:hypothetical protein ZOSMA_203G00030 [Zostera marina]|uniref:Uncharacterized protein n=1 Tax=Zostera marina TaxID=29655 RepID=A0A0K9PLM6_ZOSMR|nr:hypothetical protein ZOSMA_203G00030 [Zostera marina]